MLEDRLDRADGFQGDGLDFAPKQRTVVALVVDVLQEPLHRSLVALLVDALLGVVHSPVFLELAVELVDRVVGQVRELVFDVFLGRRLGLIGRFRQHH